MRTSFQNELVIIVQNYYLCKNDYALSSFGKCENNYSSPSYIYLRDVEVTLFSLDYDERNIIQNDFFHSSRSKWWKEQYDRKTYLLIKKTAIKNFVRKFYEIH